MTVKATLPSLVAWIILGGCVQLPAANLIDARPLTSQIILLQFEDGYVEYHGYGQTRVGHPAIQKERPAIGLGPLFLPSPYYLTFLQS